MAGRGLAVLVTLGLGAAAARADIIYERVPLYVDPLDRGRTHGDGTAPPEGAGELSPGLGTRNERLERLTRRLQRVDQRLDEADQAARTAPSDGRRTRRGQSHGLESLRERVRAGLRVLEQAPASAFPARALEVEQAMDELEREAAKVPAAASGEGGAEASRR